MLYPMKNWFVWLVLKLSQALRLEVLVIEQLGFSRCLWACFVFSLFECETEVRELVMNGIADDCEFRGQGVSYLLLDQIVI